MKLPSRIVVLGGYGCFGSRIARALAERACGELVIAGRDLDRASRCARELAARYPGSQVGAALLDSDDPRFVRQLGAIAPIIVVHTAGPFQNQDYRIAESCLACRSHYVDLADGRRFVAGFDSLDREARRRDVLLVTGASTLPGISSAVVAKLARDLIAVESVETAIAPAARNSRGRATLAGVLSYCGRAVRVREGGRWIDRCGWLDSQRVDFGVFSRRVAVCEVPDLDCFPAAHPELRTATFHAGPASRFQRAVLTLMAAAARSGIVADWSRHAGMLARVDAWLARRGSDVGAMRVRISGTGRDGTPRERAWYLVVRDNRGPEIPCLPAIALTEDLLTGRCTLRGARACFGLVEFDTLATLLAELPVEWKITENTAPCGISTLRSSSFMS